jgi:tellurite resistance protein TerC
MHWVEIAFYAGFVAFIVVILLVDLLIFDRHSHEVSIREALAWSALWLALGLGFGWFLYHYGEFIHGIHNLEDLQEVIQRYDYNIQIVPGDYQASIKAFHKEMAINYITGYLLEKTLSVDNLFVMILIFNAFNVKKIHYKRVLFWGILGAIVLRTIFIFAGAALVLRFRWILYIFGVFLIYSGIKVFFEKGDEKVEPQNHPLIVFWLSIFVYFRALWANTFL